MRRGAARLKRWGFFFLSGFPIFFVTTLAIEVDMLRQIDRFRWTRECQATPEKTYAHLMAQLHKKYVTVRGYTCVWQRTTAEEEPPLTAHSPEAAAPTILQREYCDSILMLLYRPPEGAPSTEAKEDAAAPNMAIIYDPDRTAPTTSIAMLRAYTDQLLASGIRHAVLILEAEGARRKAEKNTRAPGEELVLSVQWEVEERAFLAYDPSEHERAPLLVDTSRVLLPAAAAEFARLRGKSPSNWPRRSRSTDPLIRWYGFPVGSLVPLVRQSETAGRSEGWVYIDE